MTLSTTAARVMSLAQDGQPAAALALAERALLASADASPVELAGLWYTIAVTHHVRQDAAAQLAATERCLEAGRAAGAPGWTANALSMRAMAQARAGAVEPALLDLARSEVDLAACDDDGLRCWAHTGLGYCYLELRLYELALPHFEAAVRLDASPIPLAEAATIDLMNLAELHLRWADELERLGGDDAEQLASVERHRAVGHAHAIDAVAAATVVGAGSLLAASRAMELCSRSADDAAGSVGQLRQAFAHPDHRDHQGGRAQVGGALARALWTLGQRDQAIAVARESVVHAESAGDWQVQASAQWLLVELKARAEVPGSAAGHAYGQLLSRVLWQQRLSTLQGARAALDVERLRRDNEIAVREAAEDPLTGVGNRRALAEALAAAEATVPVGAEVGRGPAHSLLLVDLDAFKAVNDVHGHVVGDDVLRAVANALRSTARAEDVVVRLGGDEFVVLARDADAAAGRALGERVTASIAALVVESPAGPLALRASVGVATTGADVAVADLLGAADVAMYRAKGRGAPHVQPHSA
ncbi:hypothetical protein GCM10027446_22660 [Angustibacter peucedani]